MTGVFQPPPTWALPILVDEKTGKAIFNPIWLRWFLDLSKNLDSAGSPTGMIIGPTTSTNNNFAAFNGTTGLILKDSGSSSASFLGSGQALAMTGDVTAPSTGLSTGTIATTLANVGTAGTYTKITFNAKGLETSGSSAVLASADYANQGTTTTVLHGNAAGNPSWGAVDLSTDVTGSLPAASVAGTALVAAAIGTTVQAYDADLTTWAGITPGANVGTFLATPSSANLRAALTDETGTGAAVFADAPSINAPTSPAGTVYSGTYTPTIGAVTNVAATNARKCQYMRVGNYVHVAGQCDIDPTATGFTRFSITLPVASNLATIYDLGGSGATDNTASQAVLMQGDVAGDSVDAYWQATSAALQQITFSFGYEVK